MSIMPIMPIMTRRSVKVLAILGAALLVPALVTDRALADAPDPSCTAAALNGCNLGSDIFMFAQGDGTYAITGEITQCFACSGPNPDGSFNLLGTVQIKFGPYDPMLCAPGNSSVTITIPHVNVRRSATPGGPGGNEAVYVPNDPAMSFTQTQASDLRANCVTAANLDYRIPKVFFTGAVGAQTGVTVVQPPEAAYLVLPETVRASDPTGLVSRVDLNQFRLPQNLSVSTTESMPGLRLWPDGMPFRLVPNSIAFSTGQVTINTLGAAPYIPVRPDPSNLNQATQVLKCDAAGFPVPPPCNNGPIWNAGYFDDADWIPSAIQFDPDGMTLSLALAAGNSVTYETLFPRRFWLQLDAPASIQIQDGHISTGWFSTGIVWMEQGPNDDLCSAREFRKHALNSGARRPQVLPDGALRAGVTDLNLNLQPIGGNPEIKWSYNSAEHLGCGTLYIPPTLASQGPQSAWLASAVPTVLDRGVYAGLNYNRNRVCQPIPAPPGQAKFCVTTADCDSGQTCMDGGFSPLCDPLPPTTVPLWHTRIDQEPLTFTINPNDTSQGDREMVLVTRFSGVTGVFDAGNNDFSFGDTASNEFQFNFDIFGLAFKESQSEHQDTIVTGNLGVKWPADTTLPFSQMSICDCGKPDKARTPDVLFEKTLEYWSAPFSPYGLIFSKTNATQDPNDCLTVGTSSCGPPTDSSDSAQSICVEALTPVPRFEPDPVSVFALDPNGTAGEIIPYSVSRMGFDGDVVGPIIQKPYVYDIEGFALSGWPGDSAASKQMVKVLGTADFGFYDARGDLLLPYFGETAGGIRIERERVNVGSDFLADLHEEGFPDDPAQSFIRARREIAADNIVVPFKVDYFSARATEDPADGYDDPNTPQLDDLDRDGRSRGTLFAFAPEDDGDPGVFDELNLGAIQVAGALMMKPDDDPNLPAASMRIIGGDLGPAAAMRLWGATDTLYRTQLRNIMCPDPPLSCPHMQSLGSQYNAALGKLADPAYALPDAATLRQQMHQTGAIDALSGHPDASGVMNVESTPPGLSPPTNISKITGALQFSQDLEQLDGFQVGSDMDSGGQFYAFDAALLTVDRHVKSDGQQPITQIAREIRPGASQNMMMPGKQNMPFPASSGSSSMSFKGGQSLTGDTFGVQWDFDYDVTPGIPPQFEFKSLTGTVDLTAGGMSGIGIEEMGATLGFYADGDWYFSAGLLANFDGNLVDAHALFGNTKDMTPVKNIDSNVAEFLGGIPKFDGAYIRAGAAMNIWDTGCLLTINAGGEIGGWYIDDGTGHSYGGKVREYLDGKAGCVVSIRGDMTLVGGIVNDQFKLQGSFWVAGGAGFCDEDEWYNPQAVLDDDFCVACVAGLTGTGHYPPKDLDITFKKDYLECAGP